MTDDEMTDDELIAFVTEFRDGILDGRPSNWMCAAICMPLAPLLKMHGIITEIVESDLGHCNHVWLRMPRTGWALDPTGDQFANLMPGRELPPVYFGPPTEIHTT